MKVTRDPEDFTCAGYLDYEPRTGKVDANENNLRGEKKVRG